MKYAQENYEKNSGKVEYRPMKPQLVNPLHLPTMLLAISLPKSNTPIL